MSDLARRRALPPGAATELRPMRDGWRLRSMIWAAASPTRGSILFIGGRGDFIEKYAESYWHWHDRGFGLAAFDWRGQGLSGRLGDTQDKGHSTGFDALVADLGEQVAWFRDALPSPHFAVAHSMGGHLLLRHLSAQPGSIDRAVLLSPLLGLVATPVGPWLARIIATVQVARGKAGDYAPGAGAAQANNAIRARRLSSDPERIADETYWVEHDPGLRIGGVTNGWIAAAFASLDALTAPGIFEAVTTPLLILTAANDRLVDSAAAARLAKRLPHAQVEPIAGAAHELLREADAIRDPVLARIDGFLA
ncbi:alpha/beta fold hydrolase [Glacieibacterium megasporae]|uniref:alpha/beta fold hydrolase n=1 Tax=Glacieibacterium megasporae TaxID=2835787 RepID=UPI001C1E7B68|nr:alpha/beta hydrolase [Polymorphobacter megasporae]UAJ11186.1 alpha/beta hydrolase [Polymorphobacter megasporae]